MPSNPNKAKDPIQLRLREHKRNWNSSYKEVSQKLKSFKNGLNGKGDPKNSIPVSDIKDPFPGEIGATLNQVATEFQKLVSDANSIIKEQANYSRSRKKKQPKENKPNPATSPPKDKLVEQLSRIVADQYD